MTGSAKQSTAQQRKNGLLLRYNPDVASCLLRPRDAQTWPVQMLLADCGGRLIPTNFKKSRAACQSVPLQLLDVCNTSQENFRRHNRAARKSKLKTQVWSRSAQIREA